MENTVKKTKATYFEEIAEYIEATMEASEAKAEYLDFIDNQLAILEKRRVAAAARAEKKKAESDALTEVIYDKLGETPMTVDEIVEAIGDAEVTRNKVTARLGKLVRAEKVAKEAVKTDEGKRMAYFIAE